MSKMDYPDLQARVVELETALRGLVAEIDALYGPRAHHLGCECGGTNDGVHSCGTLMAAYRAAKDAANH